MVLKNPKRNWNTDYSEWFYKSVNEWNYELQWDLNRNWPGSEKVPNRTWTKPEQDPHITRTGPYGTSMEAYQSHLLIPTSGSRITQCIMSYCQVLNWSNWPEPELEPRTWMGVTKIHSLTSAYRIWITYDLACMASTSVLKIESCQSYSVEYQSSGWKIIISRVTRKC
jgi:hypothetical protein